MSKVLILPTTRAFDSAFYGYGPHQAVRVDDEWVVTFPNGNRDPFDEGEVVRFPAHRASYDPTNMYEDNGPETEYYNRTAPRLAKHREDDTYYPYPF